MSIAEFSSDHYERAYGKKPRGQNKWVFKIYAPGGPFTYISDCIKTLTEAKKDVREYIRYRYNASYISIQILP